MLGDELFFVSNFDGKDWLAAAQRRERREQRDKVVLRDCLQEPRRDDQALQRLAFRASSKLNFLTPKCGMHFH